MEHERVNINFKIENSYVDKLPPLFYTETTPTKVNQPEMIIWNKTLAEDINFSHDELSGEKLAELFSGNLLLQDAIPIAQAYAGHQFGHFTNLGDGRAILLGEIRGENGERFDLQLKGAGKTAYSRTGDGRATLGPMLREYIVSEAMYELGIPTSRSLAVVVTGEPVFREDVLEGAVLTRIASSHIRVGTFQYAAALGEKDDLRKLADYTISRHFKEIPHDHRKYLRMLEQVIERQASLIAKWQLVGFVHGVMNTDNMTVSGETIDYGPCAFLDTYKRNTVFSSIDRDGRYAYGNQPYIGAWNLTRFAETLIPILDENENRAIKMAEEALSIYESKYRYFYETGMRAKLGLENHENEDTNLIEDLLQLMEKYEADYTNTFLALTFNDLAEMSLNKHADFRNWYHRWQERLKKEDNTLEHSKEIMRKNNPAVIPRNHLVEQVIAASVNEGDQTPLIELLDVLSDPYAHTEKQKQFANKPIPNESFTTYCGT